MTDTNVLKLVQPGTFSDLLTDVLRSGAHALLAQAVEAEVASFLAANAHLQTEDGRQRLVRHGHLPERRVATGIGAVTVRQPRVRDRGQPGEPPIRFSPAILPPYARRTKSLEVLIPILHLKGVSTGDFEEALMALVGTDAGGLSASTIARLKEIWPRNMRAGSNVICRPSAMSTSGPMASTFRPGWKTTPSASSSSSARRRRARRS